MTYRNISTTTPFAPLEAQMALQLLSAFDVTSVCRSLSLPSLAVIARASNRSSGDRTAGSFGTSIIAAGDTSIAPVCAKIQYNFFCRILHF